MRSSDLEDLAERIRIGDRAALGRGVTLVESKRAGAAAIFLPGTVIAEAAQSLLHDLNRRLGYAQQAAE